MPDTTPVGPTPQPEGTGMSHADRASTPAEPTGLTCPGRAENHADQPEQMAIKESPIDPAALLAPFTLRLLRAANPTAPNLVCSPLSVLLVLTMAAHGARGKTRQQIETLLGASVDRLTALAETLPALLRTIDATDTGGASPTQARLAAELWMQQGFAIEPAFQEAVTSRFGATIREANFTTAPGREQACEHMNASISNATRGTITNLVDPSALDENTRLTLLSALYAAAAWTDRLAPAGEQTFTCDEGEQITAPMFMRRTTGWFEDADAHATMLHTAGGALGLVLIRPTRDVPALLEAWDAAVEKSGANGAGDEDGKGQGVGLHGMLHALAADDAPVDLTLPLLEATSKLQLEGVLAGLGLPVRPEADYSGISQAADIDVTGVLHQALLRVDEAGMEAAAATALVFGTRSVPAPQEVRELVLDRPFLAMVVATEGMIPLVVARIGKPEAPDA